MTTASAPTAFVSTSEILNEWLGHRRLTRKVILAFPEKDLYEFSIGGMRPFADMIKELIDVSGPGMKGLATKEWPNGSNFSHVAKEVAPTKAELLALFDQGTAEISNYLPQIPEEEMLETIMAFGAYEGQVYSTILYFIDNEVHHRAQGVVYLRALGIEPPAFWDRG